MATTSKSSTHDAHDEPFSFMSLRPELRQWVYRQVFPGRSIISREQTRQLDPNHGSSHRIVRLDDAQNKPFPFMSLHPEIRQMIYREVFSRRGIIIREKTRHLNPLHGSFHTIVVFNDARNTNNDPIPLLQTSKHIFAEAAPLLKRYTPSHLVIPKKLRCGPSYLSRQSILHSALPFQHITAFSFNVNNLGGNLKDRKCPGINQANTATWSGYPGRSCGGPYPDPKRHPDLSGISALSSFFSLFPALRELHLYSVLEYHLSHPSEFCRCPIKGTAICVCGACECSCAVYPSLPSAPDGSIAGTKDLIHKALLPRFRAALPKSQTQRTLSNYHAILELLVHDVHITLHEELTITIPIKNGQLLYKGLWRAKYRLNPPDNAETPAKIPVKVAETFKEYSVRQQEAVDEELRQSQKQLGDPDWKLGRFSPNVLKHSWAIFPYLSIEDSNPSDRRVPEAMDGRNLIEFEGGLEIELVDKAGFDIVLRNGSFDAYRTTVHEKFGKLWQWG